ncbi:response regulator [Thalassobacillus sp. C254]|uniref:response regulator n=1 Tax=Thalassobacillus sp. C254 TaxID=1225341 RepID=UPI0006D25093|nr:response regulator [Thalassobacillus sp. C254]
MTADSYTVLIVEDDFRIAEINKAFVERVPGFKVAGMTRSGVETSEFLKEIDYEIDVILLDVFIPDVEGLELMWMLREKYRQTEIIMMTAAKEANTIQEALKGGIFDYIIKPVNAERLEKTLVRLKNKRKFFTKKEELDQEIVDGLIGGGTASAVASVQQTTLPKGIDRLTLEKVYASLEKMGAEGATAVTVAKDIGASRSTARRYLEYMISTEKAHVQVTYGEVGRPERRYVFS